jgi:lipopolysaccharide transport system ATP-binding protein
MSIIHVENLGKRYRIGERERYLALRDVLARAASAPVRLFRARKPPSPNGDPTHIWALKDVSFEVDAGEVVGIIGRNGAGKTTLLKILARVTQPTAGFADVRGRMGSLLEVGTGFHPELTGRENVYLSGAILGMRKAEIERKFDEIVAFAEVEKFIDTPLKYYSTGMRMRLAFAVAAHLEPEILLVDEVLAVGDASFQKKCLERMQAVSSEGRTILFVSHNMSAMRAICQRGIVLERGGVVETGEINAVVDKYLVWIRSQNTNSVLVETPSFFVEDVRIAPIRGMVIKTFEEIEIRVRVRAKTTVAQPGLYVAVMTLENERIAGLDLRDFVNAGAIEEGQTAELGFWVKDFPVLPGSFQLQVYLKDMAHFKIELVPTTFRFDVVETPIYGGRKIDHWYGQIGLRATAFSRLVTEPSVQEVRSP